MNMLFFIRRYIVQRSNAVLCAIALVIATVALESPVHAENLAQDPVAKTLQGDLRGNWVKGVAVFRGVPYASSPVGSLRFAPPEPMKPWKGVRDALQDSPTAIQPTDIEMVPARLSRETSEDCLYLTIWTPAIDQNKRPVLVWIHGGGLITGAGSMPLYSGENLVRKGDIVVVNMNYRLGALGYVKIPGISPGNLGLQDQLAALSWVRENIQNFGGDPEQVTVAGQSGGAYSIGLMLAGSSSGYGLFKQAILESPPTGARPHSEEAAVRTAEIFLAELGIDSDAPDKLKQIQSLPAEKILAAQSATDKKVRLHGNTPAFLPVADGGLIPEEMATAAYSEVVKADMDIIVGTNRREAVSTRTNSPVLYDADRKAVEVQFSRTYKNVDRAIEAYSWYRPKATPRELILDVAGDQQYRWQALRFAQQQSMRGHNVYVYRFDWHPENAVLGPGHNIEMPFVFDTFEALNDGAALWADGEPIEMAALTERVQSTWISFIRDGAPSGNELPPWPAYEPVRRMTMLFGAISGPVGDPAAYAWRSPEAIDVESELKVMVFPGGFNWPIWAAQEQGFFAAEGLKVSLTYTTSSVEQISSLMTGSHQIGMTAIDNVVAYVEGVGEAGLDEPSDLFAFMGGDDGFLSLIVQGEIKSFQDLEGRNLAVDAMTTGYAFVLRKMLHHGGISEDKVNFVSVGGALQRMDAMKQGKYAGTVLMTPFDIIAKLNGMNQLLKASDVFDHYQGVVGASRRSWAESHNKELVSYIRAYRMGLRWLFDHRNKQAAQKILMEHLPNVTEPLADKIYAILLAPEGGFEPNAILNIEGLRTVLDLRNQFGGGTTSLSDPSSYYDSTYFDQAVTSR